MKRLIILLFSIVFTFLGCACSNQDAEDNTNLLDESKTNRPISGIDVQWSGWTIEQFVDSSSCVFYGKCISKTESTIRQELTFEIEEVYKGKYDPLVSEFTALKSITFNVGNHYLLFCGLDASVYSGEDHYGISTAVCDDDYGLYHEGIFNLNLSSLEEVREYVYHYIADHPTDNKVPVNNDYCRSDDLRDIYDYASTVIVAKILGITDDSNTDRTSYSFEVKEILKGDTDGELWITAFKDSLKIGEDYILLLDKPEKTSVFFKMCSRKSIIPVMSEEAALIRSFSD